MCELQQGVQVAFSVDAVALEIVSVSRFSAPVDVIPDDDLAETDSYKVCPGTREKPQMMTLVARNIGTQARLTKGAKQTMTRTSPLVPGGLTPEIHAMSGFIVDIREPEFNSDSDARQTIEIDWMPDGLTPAARTAAT